MTSIKGNLESDSMVRAEPSARERRRTEEALHASEERYRRPLELVSDAIVLHSDGDPVLANEAAGRLFSAANPEQLLGKPMGHIVAAKNRSAIQKAVQKPSARGGNAPFVKRKLIRVASMPRAPPAPAATTTDPRLSPWCPTSANAKRSISPCFRRA